MPLRSAKRGFMEPTKHATYYEDARTKATDDDHLIEARAFDLCEDSSDAESDDPKAKRTRKNAQHITSYGSIKKPTYKPRKEANRQPAYKIAPHRNSRHSIRLLSDDSDEDERPQAHFDVPQTQSFSVIEPTTKLSAKKAYAEEKAWQHQLSPTSRFNNVLKVRAENRFRLHNACQRARKTKERALRDAEIAASCLVEAVPESTSYIQLDNANLPTDFVDLTRRAARRTEKRLAHKMWPPQNWKGEHMGLSAGDAYVLVLDCEQVVE